MADPPSSLPPASVEVATTAPCPPSPKMRPKSFNMAPASPMVAPDPLVVIVVAPSGEAPVPVPAIAPAAGTATESPPKSPLPVVSCTMDRGSSPPRAF